MHTAIPWTVADLDLFPETLDDTRYEILDGELHVSHQPRIVHQHASGEVFYALKAWSNQTGRGMTFAAPGVIFAPNDAVAPDVLWISEERMRGGVDEGGHFRVAPELMVEVVSPGSDNERRDKELKLDRYSRYGVDEYWIVDLPRFELLVYRRQSGSLQIVGTLRREDSLRSPLFPGFQFAVSKLWMPGS